MPNRDLEQRIRERAFYLWIEQGRPEGRDREHWQQAERELKPARHHTALACSSGRRPRQSQTVAQSWDAYRR